MQADLEILAGMNAVELEALASATLSTMHQVRMNELIALTKERALPPNGELELDQLIEIVDHLTLLKARAQYTLNQLNRPTAAK